MIRVDARIEQFTLEFSVYYHAFTALIVKHSLNLKQDYAIQEDETNKSRSLSNGRVKKS